MTEPGANVNDVIVMAGGPEAGFTVKDPVRLPVQMVAVT